jgi:hypothetical protein
MTSDLVAENNQTLWSKLLKIVKSEYWFYNLIQLECHFLGFYQLR